MTPEQDEFVAGKLREIDRAVTAVVCKLGPEAPVAIGMARGRDFMRAGTSDEAQQTIGLRMRARRGLKGWSLDRLASESRVTRSYLWKLETGDDPNPSLKTLRKLAQSLGTSVGWLVGAECVKPAEFEIYPQPSDNCEDVACSRKWTSQPDPQT